MHVLIIPGERLNKEDHFSSTFELSQCNALSSYGHNVSLLSVTIKSGFLFTIKFHFNRLLTFLNSIKKGFTFHAINEFYINGLRTIEVCGSTIKSNSTSNDCLHSIQLSIRGFEYYLFKYGRPDIIHGHSRFLKGGLIAYELSKRFNIPYVVTEHSSAYGLKQLSDFELRTSALMINESDAFVVVSKFLGDSIEKALNKKLQKNYVVIPNVIDAAFETNVPAFGKQDDCFVFLSIANFNDNKAQKNLLIAFSKVFKGNSKYKLRIAGKGETEGELKILCEQLGIICQVDFLGFINKDQVVFELDRSDVFVLTSHFETFGVVLIEALSRGVPVIATKSGGPEEIINTSNGLLVNANNINELVDQMQSIIRHYSSFNKLQIRNDCIARFGSEAFVNSLTTIYHRIITQ